TLLLLLAVARIAMLRQERPDALLEELLTARLDFRVGPGLAAMSQAEQPSRGQKHRHHEGEARGLPSPPVASPHRQGPRFSPKRGVVRRADAHDRLAAAGYLTKVYHRANPLGTQRS